MNDRYALATSIGQKADAAASDDEAIRLYMEAWGAVPEPKLKWEGALWIWKNVAGIYLDANKPKEALEAARLAESAPRGADDSQVQFMLGRIYLDHLNDEGAAREHLKRAWTSSEGREFSGRPDRYVQALKGQAVLDDVVEAPTTGIAEQELPDSIHGSIQDLCGQGDELADQGNLAEALASYRTALSMLPEPREQWDAFVWIQSAIGDAHFQRRDWENSETAFQRAKRGGGVGNPFIHLRLGQIAHEQGRFAVAVDELLRAYMGGGEEVFQDDPKHLEFLASNVDLTRPGS